MASNHTNPSSPYVRMPANTSAILAGWPAACVAPVSAMSIGSPVSSRTAMMVGPNIGSELPGRIEVVAVDPHPGHVRLAGPPGSRAGNLAVLRLDDVDCPHPGHVPGSVRTEEGDDVPPCGHESRRGCMPVTPGVPGAVHFVAEAQNDRIAIGADGPSVGGQVSVVLPSCDRGEAHVSRVDLHQRHRTVLGHGRGEAGLERLQPAAVVHDQSRLDPGGTRERRHPGVRGRCPGRIDAEIGPRSSREGGGPLCVDEQPGFAFPPRPARRIRRR